MCPRLEHEGLAVRVGSKGSPRKLSNTSKKKPAHPVCCRTVLNLNRLLLGTLDVGKV